MPENSLRLKAVVRYGNQTLEVPVEIAEDIQDVLLAIDRVFDGGHWLRLDSEEGKLRLWLTSGIPVTIQYPADYETPDDRKSYVETWLETGAKIRLGIHDE